MAASLPAQLAPMLCRIGKPFDADDHLFEVKWDGVRALAFVDGAGDGTADGDAGWRLHSRHRPDLRSRYPELAGLRALPAGTLLDGELVVLDASGKPDFPAVLGRENARRPERVRQLAQQRPVVYVAFDLLYDRFDPLLERPLQERRDRLQQLLGQGPPERVVLSEGVVGTGLLLFEQVRQQGLEGVVAKQLGSRYRPGERSHAWQKIKAVHTVPCAVLGYEPDGERDFKSLIVAAEFDGRLQCVGRVGSGFTLAQKAAVWSLLQARRRETAWLPAGMSGCWVEPGLYCSVSYLERMASGSLRAPVFAGMIEA
ncbi:MAG: DNA ligase [Planctomycetota bacterium]